MICHEAAQSNLSHLVSDGGELQPIRHPGELPACSHSSPRGSLRQYQHSNICLANADTTVTGRKPSAYPEQDSGVRIWHGLGHVTVQLFSSSYCCDGAWLSLDAPRRKNARVQSKGGLGVAKAESGGLCRRTLHCDQIG